MRELVKIYVWESTKEGKQEPSAEDLAGAQVFTEVPTELDEAEASTATWKTKVRAVFDDGKVLDCWWGDSPYEDSDSLRWMSFSDYSMLSDCIDMDSEHLDDE